MKSGKISLMELTSVKNTDGKVLSTASYRNMLDNICKDCYVESETTRQFGTVVNVIKNKYHIPVCLMVKHDTGYDYISVDRVSLYEQFDNYVSNEEYCD